MMPQASLGPEASGSEPAEAEAIPPPPPPQPRKLLGTRSLGLDWGTQKIGMAITAGFTQRPLGTIENQGRQSRNITHHHPTLDYILRTFKAEDAVRIVVGMPYFK
jgi:hypothetical protein